MKNVICIVVIFFFSINSYALDERNWMRDINGSTKLTHLTIPGTHDSAAFRTTSLAETQDWSIRQQLENGIRFFDIRISNRIGSVNDFELRHGDIFLGSFNDLVMDEVESFLDAHDGEVIFMSIKHEKPNFLADDGLDISRLNQDYINAPGTKFYQHSITGSTELDTVRSHIVLFNRYTPNNDSVGIGWKNDLLKIQDEYELDTECYEQVIIPATPFSDAVTQRICGPQVGLDYPKKALQVKEHLDEAHLDFNSSKIWINFASAQYNGFYISNTADYVNPKVKEYFYSGVGSTENIGSIILMDYPNRTANLISDIINNNDRSSSSNTNIIPSGNLGSAITDGFWGTWGSIVKCSSGQYVYGYKLKSESEGGDDTALNGIELWCGNSDVGVNFPIQSATGPYGDWGGLSSLCPYYSQPVVGFDIKIEPKQGDDDDTAANDIDLYCKDGPMINAPTNNGQWGNWTPRQNCPSGQAVTGIITRVEDSQGDGDDTALNGVRLICEDF